MLTRGEAAWHTLSQDKDTIGLRFRARAPEEAWGREAGDLQLFGFHSHLWAEPPERLFYDHSPDDRQAHGSQAEGASSAVAQADARECGKKGEVAGDGGSRVLP